jgi:hypothetical protein
MMHQPKAPSRSNRKPAAPRSTVICLLVSSVACYRGRALAGPVSGTVVQVASGANAPQHPSRKAALYFGPLGHRNSEPASTRNC